MRYHTDTVAQSLAAFSNIDALYQLRFVGGPYDGHVLRTNALPQVCVDLASGPAQCGTRIGATTVRRWGEVPMDVDASHYAARIARGDRSLPIPRHRAWRHVEATDALASRRRGPVLVVAQDRKPRRADRHKCADRVSCTKLTQSSAPERLAEVKNALVGQGFEEFSVTELRHTAHTKGRPRATAA